MDSRWLSAGCEAVIPAIVTGGTRFSTSDRLGSRTNVPHREWIYRQGYPLGRHLIGYELQKALAVVDWFKSQPGQVPVSVAGLGEGGRGYVRVPQGQARLEVRGHGSVIAPSHQIHNLTARRLSE